MKRATPTPSIRWPPAICLHPVEVIGLRTDDPLLAKQVLFQLSYTPIRRDQGAHTEALGAEAPLPTHTARCPPHLVGQGGFEPPTPRLSSVCSNQLSY